MYSMSSIMVSILISTFFALSLMPCNFFSSVTSASFMLSYLAREFSKVRFACFGCRCRTFSVRKETLIIRSSANMAFTSPLYSSSKTAQMSFSRTRSPRLNCLYRRRISKLWSFNDIAVLARAFSSVYASMMTASSMFNKIKTMINMKDQNQICAFSRPISAIMPKSQSPNMARKQEFTARGRVVKPSMSWPKNKMLLTTRQKKTQKKTMPKWIKSSVALSKVLVTIASRGCAWKDLNNLHMMMLG
mmetsp:Transcript_59122/g.153694  ORF Transcript_59122/g.153694 Transcript_59122/m.153694 type:complete len:246 (-) Transcript_59122:28-765(-)